MKSRWITVSLAALALLRGASALADETTTAEPRDLGAKPILRTLRAGQAPRTPPIASPEAFARWDATQGKPILRTLRAANHPPVLVAPEQSTAVVQCWGMKPVMRTLGHCGEERPEVGAASGRP